MSFSPLVSAQIAGIVLVFAALAFFPPMAGRTILIPLGGDPHRVFTIAFANGASLVERGPLAGSIVIQGRRGDMLGTLYHDHILMLAAPYAGCGGAA
jgi:hypothetical protein